MGGSPDAARCGSPGVTPESVKVGLIFPDSGLNARQFAAARSGVTARLGAVNAAGGINGRKINYVWRDDQSTKDTNLTVARNLIEREDAFGIIEISPNASGSAAYLNKHGIPVAGNALESVWGDYPNMFSYTNRLSGSGSSITTWGMFVRARGGTRAAIVEVKIAETSRNVSEKIAESLRSAGITVAAALDYVPGVTNPEQLARQIRDLDVDVLTGAISADDFARTQIAARAAGVNFRVVLAPTGYDRSTLDKFGARIAGTYYFTTFIPFEMNTPALRTYRAAMATYAPELRQADEPIALTGYISTDLFLRGLQEAGTCPTREGFVTRLRQLRDFDGGGLLPGPVSLADTRQPNLCYTFVQANEAGTGFEVVQDAAPLCGSRIPARSGGASSGTSPTPS